MKQTISIFVSGAKRLKDHRMRLKVLANDMNGELRKKGYDLVINMYSYLNLGDDQKEYDEFIKHKSDIVFFIIEDTLGEKTRDEYLLASEQYKKVGSPKIYVFLKEFQQRTPEIESIENLINTYSSNYYIEYANIEDLVSKVKSRLQQDVNERLEKMNATPEKKVRKFKYWALAASVVLLGMIGGAIYQTISMSNDMILLFAGGGSAVNCLKISHPEIGDVYEYDKSIAIGLPTSAAWSLISAEILHHHAIKGKRVETAFYPVCMSAKKATETDFLKLCDRDQFIKKGSIISVYVGDDRLMVYVKKSMESPHLTKGDTITVTDLAGLIRDAQTQDQIIFCTQEGSGTLLSYRELLAPEGIEISKKTMENHLQWFSQQTPSNKIRRNEQPYILLGSEHYVANEVYDEGDCRGLIVIDKEGQTTKKPCYIYFAGYYHDEEGSTFWIPDRMVEFLKKLNPRYGEIIKDNLIPRKNEALIVSLDELLPSVK